MSAVTGMTSMLPPARAAADVATARRTMRSADVARLVAAGEEALRAGDAAAALALFERAAEREHGSDIELGIVRAHMQGGHYRRALAFAAHVARSHEEAEGSILFAQLLDVGGQPQLARRVLSRAERLEPASTVAPQTWRPAATGAAVPARARTVATGTVIDAGLHVVAPVAALPPRATATWVRDALGRTAAATRTRDALDLGLSLLRIEKPWPDTPAPAFDDRPTFAGSVVHAMAFASTAPDAAWPVMRTGFLRTHADVEGALVVPRFDASRLPGGAVFDAQGRWKGVWIEAGTGGGLLVAARALIDGFGQPSLVADEPRRPTDEIVERSMRWTVQVLADGAP